METKPIVSIKPATDKVKKQKEELQLELTCKEETLDSHKVRLSGGINKKVKREVMSIDKELERTNLIIEMRMIEIQKAGPLRPNFIYENDSRWREIKNKFQLEEVDNMKKAVNAIKEQKEKILKEIPELEAEIKVLKEKLK